MLVVGGGVVVGVAVCSGADSTGCAHVSSKRTVPYRLKVTASYMQGRPRTQVGPATPAVAPPHVRGA